MRTRYLITIPLVAVLCVSPLLAGPASAAVHGAKVAPVRKPEPTHKPVPTHKPEPTHKPAPTHKPEPTHKAEPTEKPKPATPFAANGTLTGVAGRTLTLLVKGGKEVRGTSVSVTVADTAKITLNDQTVTLDAVPLGAHVTVVGRLSGTVRTATGVHASARSTNPSASPSTSPSAAPTTAPTTAPTDMPTDAPTATPTDAPTDTPTADPTV